MNFCLLEIVFRRESSSTTSTSTRKKGTQRARTEQIDWYHSSSFCRICKQQINEKRILLLCNLFSFRTCVVPPRWYSFFGICLTISCRRITQSRHVFRTFHGLKSITGVSILIFLDCSFCCCCCVCVCVLHWLQCPSLFGGCNVDKKDYGKAVYTKATTRQDCSLLWKTPIYWNAVWFRNQDTYNLPNNSCND